MIYRAPPIDRPIAVMAAAAFSPLGFGLGRQLEGLASSEPLPADREPTGAPLGALAADEWARLEAAHAERFPESERSAGLLAAAELLAPLARALDRAGIPADERGLLLGTATAGLPDTTARLRAGLSGPRAWRALELGRAPDALARAFGFAGPVYAPSSACTAGSKAIADAARLLRAGRVRAVVAGGLDVKNALTEAGFAALGARKGSRARPFARTREGLHLGEGGGMLLLTLHPEDFDAPPLARLSGWGESEDARHISAPDPEGRGAEQAIRLSLERAGCGPDDVGFALLHGTATEQNDRMEALLMRRLFPDALPSASVKHAVGHALAGAGAYGAALAAGIFSRGAPLPVHWRKGAGDPDPDAFLPGLTRQALDSHSVDHILVNAFAFGGSNAALMLSRWRE